ncbi:MAG: hypothetical protein N2257_04255 [Thermodesulfovibrionales bacterium]|nr:hypothetical protein [Thermodesulfovibrionales bacterium]
MIAYKTGKLQKKAKDERKCPRCGSERVNTLLELIERPCPSCKEGIIDVIDSDIIVMA